jgi:hypothetical protein
MQVHGKAAPALKLIACMFAVLLTTTGLVRARADDKKTVGAASGKSPAICRATT